MYRSERCSMWLAFCCWTFRNKHLVVCKLVLKLYPGKAVISQASVLNISTTLRFDFTDATLHIGLQPCSELYLSCVFCTHLAIYLTLPYAFSFDVPISISEERERETKPFSFLAIVTQHSLCLHQLLVHQRKGKRPSFLYVPAGRDLSQTTEKCFFEWSAVIYISHFVFRKMDSMTRQVFFVWTVTACVSSMSEIPLGTENDCGKLVNELLWKVNL